VSVVCAELEDESVLLNIETGVYYGLDPLGTQIWQLLAEGAAEDDIVSRLLQEYEVDIVQLRADISRFLQQLHAQGLIDVDGV